MTTEANLQSPFLRDAVARGQFHQCTDLEGLDKAALAGVTGYIGFDMTAPSLHVGNLTQIMYLRRLQQAGGKPIVLLGGGTTRVGDPSGKEEMRQLLSEEQIVKNTNSIRGTFEKFLKFGDGPSDATLVDNSEWLLKLNYLEFLRTVGRHMSVNRMLSMDSVKLRLEREQPMSFIEFNYMILQAYDFVELKKRYNCSLQMGGSDQWGNIVNGVELGRRMESYNLFGLTQPLITTASGAKMGKTADGAVWLNADMKSPYEYWQYWRNSEDADVGRFLKIFTDLPLHEIARLEALQGAEINDAKKVLATEATALLHGRDEANKAQEAARATFEQGARSDNLPTFPVTSDELAQGLRVTAAFTRAELVASNGEAKRHISAGALRVNDNAISDEAAMLTSADVVDGAIKLSLGKKKHALLRVT
ncbi:tyrosine--tRNA ligase [Candidatus Viadribacter manganicus]|uniref:Tyrosine--tRNA ligase n=1 Tax=Candidatus Viadribacter manganicus TaxID=1759059 RepID=A0A1B1ADT4_9PROT|nr:tyrosine--tRNA ligase [Candidatus Viadribacter manganicus]ANP44716.1 tyrosine--tRNA ligase [Candidatus Viadribacter manganicus]